VKEEIRIGQGWDIHRLVRGRTLVLGGVEVPSTTGEEAHSDGDVLLHAIIDALLGALALGDIGDHFPPSREEFKNSKSTVLLERTLALIEGWEIINLDSTLILEKPKLKEYKAKIRENLSFLVGLPIHRISMKAKTAEGLGETGRGEAVEARVALLLRRRGRTSGRRCQRRDGGNKDRGKEDT